MDIQNGTITQGAPGDPVTNEERAVHVQKIMDRFFVNSPIYSLMLQSIKLVSATRGAVTTSLVLEPKHVNSRGTLHGAVSATIIDFTTALVVAAWDLRDSTGASVDMHISYLSTAKVGDTVEILSTIEKFGGSLSFSTIRISKVEADGTSTLVTLAQHTKYVRKPGAAASQAPKA